MKQIILTAILFGWCAFIMGGCAYVVFWRGESGWWFVFAFFIISLSGYKESKTSL